MDSENLKTIAIEAGNLEDRIFTYARDFVENFYAFQ